MKISILTLFPEMFRGPFDCSIVKRAIKSNLVQVEIVDIRDFGLGKHKMVDDTPYGGGTGMILRVDVLEKAINKTKDNKKGEKVILTSPQGNLFNQEKAIELSKLNHLIIVCGHYEGTDSRLNSFVDEQISVGDFITTGGEIPAMLITDSIVRLVKGVLKEKAINTESFPDLLEYPQYTKPRNFRGLKVPPVLLSGNHKKIKDYKETESIKLTKKLRPDLLKKES